ncbi:MAG: hypothetical protein IT508_10945, partial [Burkholderiaceae bacterium]|nr:hypothetical protein [Burkholderiaceae bacterium]
GVFAYVDPTARALSLVEAGEYRFASPTVHFDWTNPQSGKAVGPTLLSLALTTRPFIRGMLPVEVATFSDLRASRAEGDTMPTDTPQTVTLADHEAALLTLKDELRLLADRATTAETALATLKDEIATTAATADVEAAISAGKVAPAAREKFLALRKRDPSLFADVIDLLPVTAPMRPAGVDAPSTPPEQSYEDMGAALVKFADEIAAADGCSPVAALLKARAAHPELASGF